MTINKNVKYSQIPKYFTPTLSWNILYFYHISRRVETSSHIICECEAISYIRYPLPLFQSSDSLLASYKTPELVLWKLYPMTKKLILHYMPPSGGNRPEVSLQKLPHSSSRHRMKPVSGWTPQRGGSPEQKEKETDQD